MNGVVLTTLTAALRRAADATSLSAAYHGVLIHGCGLASPYLSHWAVTYDYVTGPMTNHFGPASHLLWIKANDQQTVLCLRWMRDDLADITAELPMTLLRRLYAQEWVTGILPSGFARPLLERLRKLLPLPGEISPLIQVAATRPVLGGWYNDRPAYLLAADPRDEPIARQGGLSVYLAAEGALPASEVEASYCVYPYVQVLNHALRCCGEDDAELGDYSIVELAPLGVLRVGSLAHFAWGWNPGKWFGRADVCRVTITSYDHEEVVVEVDMDDFPLVLTHPIPTREGVD